jgi:hypothetical protein
MTHDYFEGEVRRENHRHREPPKISLPHVKSCKIKGASSLFDETVFPNLQQLQFITGNMLRNKLESRLIPVTLTELALKKVYLLQQEAPTEPHCLPNLRTLKFSYSNLDCELSRHFALPNLESLYIKEVKLWLAQGTRRFRLSPNEPFLQVGSKLELLFLEKAIADDNLVQGLQNCLRFRYLTLLQCNTDEFLPIFTTNLTYGGTFGALESFRIAESWTQEASLSYNGLIEDCAHSRPHLNISGNGLHFDDDEDDSVIKDPWLVRHIPRPIGESLSDDSMTLPL